ncbi:acetyl esterase/lipase [Hephaestia caeni]|uniref:Acetyl esterase/lipase n=1 Tax=Hephaestia caeni TaxID=645617 RepID=A0A397PBJ0_9SPHN|nr:alpha/beta hydrolase [Hephaestia caeni]RIA44575.1 acetyl esterase/lipase [Hephaestia caeni]
MTLDRRTLVLAGLAAPAIGGVARAQSSPPLADLPGPDEEIDLWPGAAPGMPAVPPREVIIDRSKDHAFQDRAVEHVARPRLGIFRAARPNGAALLIAPGGGYQRVVVDKEGNELGRWLSARGITAYVLTYRLPGDGWKAGPDVALADAQRAMRLIRGRARRDAVDPERVGVMGFSAGGHVCADLATRFARGVYDPVDASDRLSARPFVAAPIYPVQSMHAPLAHPGSRDLLIGANASRALESAHTPAENVPADAPPFFLCHAEDDATVPVGNTIELRAAVRARGIVAETHLFTEGGHGFGLRSVVGKPAGAWPDLFLAWGRMRGFC